MFELENPELCKKFLHNTLDNKKIKTFSCDNITSRCCNGSHKFTINRPPENIIDLDELITTISKYDNIYKAPCIINIEPFFDERDDEDDLIMMNTSLSPKIIESKPLKGAWGDNDNVKNIIKSFRDSPVKYLELPRPIKSKYIRNTKKIKNESLDIVWNFLVNIKCYYPDDLVDFIKFNSDDDIENFDIFLNSIENLGGIDKILKMYDLWDGLQKIFEDPHIF